MLYAIIDIGSSIIKYKIFEYENNIIEPVIIHDKSTGLISYRKENKLAPKGINVLIETLTEFKTYSNKLNVDKTYYFATASLRNITNKKEVLKKVKQELNIDITILTGEEEAENSFKSIKRLELPSDEGVFVDIGGGSSEITIFQNRTQILEQKSIPTGVLKIYNNYVALLYPTKNEQQIIIEKILEKISETKIKTFKKKYLYGIGKTFMTIKKLFEHLEVKEDKTNVLTIEQVDIILNRLSSNTKENYKPALLVDSERIHTIIPSLLIVKALSIKFNIKKIYVCDVTLQDGLIYKVIDNI